MHITHDGDWQDIENFDTRRSYNPNEKVPKGRTWTMLDEDGSSGLTQQKIPIEIHGNIQRLNYSKWRTDINSRW